MAETNRLTVRSVETLKAGNHADGRNLYLRVSPTGSRSWVFRYKAGGRAVELGLGATHARSLKDARDLATAMRAALANGDDPASLTKLKRDVAAMTFKEHATALIEAKGREFKSGKHHAQWTATLIAYVYPKIGRKRCAEVSYADVLAIVGQPELKGKYETLSRVRGRIEAVLDEAAKQEGEPKRYNPAMSVKLPKRKVAVKHHSAAPWQEVPAIMTALRLKDCTSAYLLRFGILTAARSGEVRGMVWTELDGPVWAVPGERMKTGNLHRVPLCEEALAIVAVMRARRSNRCPYVFPGAQGGLISDVAVNKTLHLIAPAATAHGFRSSFRDWGEETTDFKPSALELCLAHTNPNKVEAAYKRSDMFEARKPIMDAWAVHCATPTFFSDRA